MEAVLNLTVNEVYEILKKDYQDWHPSCQSCKGEGDFSFACYMGNYLFKSGNKVYAFVFTGVGEEEEIMRVKLIDGKLIIINDPRWYVAPWVTTEDITKLLDIDKTS